MKALIPAAGKGTRLRPITENKPKALVDINNKPLIEHLIEELLELEIEGISIVKGYLGDKLRDSLKKYDVEFIEQEKQLGTAHAVGKSNFDEPFLVVNGDVFVHKKNLEKVIGEFEEGDGKVVMGTKRVKNPEEYGVIEVSGEDVENIIEKPEKPPTKLINTGIYAFSPVIYDYIEKTKLSKRDEYEITDSLKLMLKENIPVKYVTFWEYWIDIGRPEDLERARKLGD